MDYYRAGGKPVVVIQFGNRYTKVGVASEAEPRAILPTPELQSEFRHCYGTTSLNESDWVLIVQNLLQRIFNFSLKIPSQERLVVIVEQIEAPLALRQALIRVLFDMFHVPSISVMSDLATPLHCCGINTGIVVDVGYTSTRILPVCFGYPQTRGLKLISRAGRWINKRLHALLLEDTQRELDNESPTEELTTMLRRSQNDKAVLMTQIQQLTENTLENIKTKFCYVRFKKPSKIVDDEKNESSFFESSRGMMYKLDDSSVHVYVTAATRWKACEGLFAYDRKVFTDTVEEIEINTAPITDSKIITTLDTTIIDNGDNSITLVDAILEAVEACSIDIRRLVVQNILLAGGTAELRGLQFRLASELMKAMRKSPTLSHLEERVKFGCTSFAPFMRQWTGASIVGSQDLSQYEYTAADYASGNPFPDSLKHFKKSITK